MKAWKEAALVSLLANSLAWTVPEVTTVVNKWQTTNNTSHLKLISVSIGLCLNIHSIQTPSFLQLYNKPILQRACLGSCAVVRFFHMFIQVYQLQSPSSLSLYSVVTYQVRA